MAIHGLWRDGFIQINGTDLSDHAREIALDIGIAELPDNVHGDYVAKVRAGLEDWTITVTFLQDFAASKVDATLISAGGSAGHPGFNVIVGGDKTTAVSATNPRYSGSAIMSSYRPFGGPHGSNMEATATFRPAGRLTRQTA